MIIKKPEAFVFFLIQILIINVGLAQGFERLPVIGGDLDTWFGSVAANIDAPIMKGVYFYKKDEEMITPEQNPFFEESWDGNGTITYEGRHYQNVSIGYNVSEDLLLISSLEMKKNRQKSLLINQSKIDSFTVHNQKFLNYRHARIGDKGFYKKVIEGRQVTCYEKVTKTGSLEDTGYEYEEQRQYWVRYMGELYDYKRIPSLYKIFPDYKKQIRKFYNENRSFSRVDRERFHQLILFHCDAIVE